MVLVDAIQFQFEPGEQVRDHNSQDVIQEPSAEAGARGSPGRAAYHRVHTFCLLIMRVWLTYNLYCQPGTNHILGHITAIDLAPN